MKKKIKINISFDFLFDEYNTLSKNKAAIKQIKKQIEQLVKNNFIYFDIEVEKNEDATNKIKILIK